jgi:hypothetical protein
MFGVFEYDSTLYPNTTDLTYSQLSSFYMALGRTGHPPSEGLLLGINLPNMNFHFNTVTGEFAIGGAADSSTGQGWNSSNATCTLSSSVGFISGPAGRAVCVNGDSQPYGFSTNPIQVPAPATIALLALGLFGMGAAHRKQA